MFHSTLRAQNIGVYAQALCDLPKWTILHGLAAFVAAGPAEPGFGAHFCGGVVVVVVVVLGF